MHTPQSHFLAWQRWRLSIPATWNPVKVDGDAGEGALLLADLHAARLGLRWRRTPKRGDPVELANRAMTGEVGALAAAEAVDLAMPDTAAWIVSRFYRDPAPPGRDVWVGVSRHSGRMLQIVHHAVARDRNVVDAVLRSLTDVPADGPMLWAIFDLTFATQPGTVVRWYRFNAGDLSVGLSDPRGRVTMIRQVGPASLALARQPLKTWLTQLPTATRRLYRPAGEPTPTARDYSAESPGLRTTLVRKRRYFWAWFVASEQTVIARHDIARDRLVLGQSADADALETLLATVVCDSESGGT